MMANATGGLRPLPAELGRLVSEAARLYAAQGLAQGHEELEEAAHAVRAFLSEGRAGGSPGTARLAMARAMGGLGRRTLARQLVLSANGVIRPTRSTCAGDGVMWVVDLGRLGWFRGTALNLALARFLLEMLDTLADSWDGRGGRGTLGLRNVDRAVGRLGGCRRGQMAAGRREIYDLCRHKLEHLRRERQWPECPRVMNLDYSAG